MSSFTTDMVSYLKKINKESLTRLLGAKSNDNKPYYFSMSVLSTNVTSYIQVTVHNDNKNYKYLEINLSNNI